MNKAKDNTMGKTLVVGAGLSGIRSALDLAQTGYQVLLIDSADHMGGLVSQLDYQFPTSTCGYCRSLPMFDRDRSSQHCLRKGLVHENIEILLSTELMSVQGEPGDFTVTLKQKPSLVDPSLCTGCGDCEPVCPVLVDDPFNEGLTQRKAIYLPSPQSFPNAWTIDYTACTRCGECERICPVKAIKFTDQDREKFKILVVDDEKIVRDSMKEWLKEEGFSVKTADSGQSALDLMEAGAFNMVLTDIKMPGMDGVELLTKAKQINPEICVIMMTAYAAVDSAVEAMKQGALDYLTKPFDPDVLVSMVLKIYNEFEIAEARVERVDALILSTGTRFFQPEFGKNPYGYGVLSGVVTAMEFERLISGTGPSIKSDAGIESGSDIEAGPDMKSGMTRAELIHPTTQKPVKRIAWFQCVGSRDVQANAGFCSTVCCMISIKEAILARQKFGPDIEAVIFYMDMRTVGKTFDLYRQTAEQEHGVRFVRARVHSLAHESGNRNGSLVARYVDTAGKIHDDGFDLVVLATGQRPNIEMSALAAKNNLDVNSWGFISTRPFSMIETSMPGILASGSVAGLKDISDSVTCASAAALGASKIMVRAGRQTRFDDYGEVSTRLARENPKILIVLCLCDTDLLKILDMATLKAVLERVPELIRTPANEVVHMMDDLCRDTGKKVLKDLIKKTGINRLILGACPAGINQNAVREIATEIGLDSDLVEVLDMVAIVKPYLVKPYSETQAQKATQAVERGLKTLVSRARFKNPVVAERVRSNQSTLVIGGGIAGITSALSIADCGYHVDLVEQSDALGGNLLWMDKTVDGLDIQEYLSAKIQELESHDRVRVHKNSEIVDVERFPGEFASVVKTGDQPEQTIFHGVTILATGASQASLDSAGDGAGQIMVTQKDFETGVQAGRIDPEQLNTVVMIQCSGTREGSRNYCSRVCCIRALKNAVFLKETNPDIQVYILYRDMMSYGFFETYYIQAKNLGVVFFQYDAQNKPMTRIQDDGCLVKTRDLLLDMPVEILADCVIHATGIVPDLPAALAELYGAGLDEFSFFKEADPKFRPVDSMNYRVFSCGMSLKPCNIQEAVTTAEACAARAVQILSHEILVSGKRVAATHTAYCSLCEMCVDACPYGARFVDHVEEKILIDPAACQGCGVCASVCPSDSAFLEGLDSRQMLDVIDMALS